MDLPGWRTHAPKISTASPETPLVHASPPVYPMLRTVVGLLVYGVPERPLMSAALGKREQDHEASPGLLKTEENRAESKELVAQEDGHAVSTVLVTGEEDHAESEALE